MFADSVRLRGLVFWDFDDKLIGSLGDNNKLTTTTNTIIKLAPNDHILGIKVKTDTANWDDIV